MLRPPFKSRFASFYGYEYFVALKQLTSNYPVQMQNIICKCTVIDLILLSVRCRLLIKISHDKVDSRVYVLKSSGFPSHYVILSLLPALLSEEQKLFKDLGEKYQT